MHNNRLLVHELLSGLHATCIVACFGFVQRPSCTVVNFMVSALGALANSTTYESASRQSDKEDVLEDGFSDLEVPLESADSLDGAGKEDEELISEGELSEEAADSSLDLVDVEASEVHLISMLGKGNLLEGMRYLSIAMLNLRKLQLYSRALLFVEWLEASKKIELAERDYVSHLDLIAKVNGLLKAEKYIEKIPESFRNEVVYLLANYVAVVNVKKAEEVFDEIRDLGLPITPFACNRLLLLYKRVDGKSRTHDISGMEQILEIMKSEGVEPDLLIKSLVAKAYIFSGLTEKVEATLKEIEDYDILENCYLCKVQENHNVFKVLLPLYAAFGKPDDVARIWKVWNKKPYLDEC
ncbi:hypothetical protein ZIOFF_022016 [Zingiber officinale]|uniref:Pentatricopeptide repeat-containing protein n=1 Tax=Zingiber officinale TaxID=94328 RepID=A0A8J5LMF4_ZINOF|nr:hypothetical protein ZIOFF_022016 [Zingiber officinale]